VSLGIRVNLFAGFGVVLALLVAIGYIGLRNTTELTSQFKTLYDERMMSVMKLVAAQEGLYELRMGSASVAYVLAAPQQRSVMLAADEPLLKQVDDNIRAYEAINVGADNRTEIEHWNAGYQAFLKARKQVIELSDAGNVNAAAALRAGDLYTQAAQSDDTINRLLAAQQSVGKQMSQDAIVAADLWQRVLLFFTFLALCIGLCVAHFVSRGVARGVQAVQKVLTSLTENCARFLEEGLAAMSANDLSVAVQAVTQPIEHYGRDEIGQTALVTNTLVTRLHSTIGSYERARMSLGDLVGQVRSASDGLADSSSQLGTTAHQTGSAVEQVTTAIQNVAAGAQDTSRGAQETNTAVTQLAQAINGIARGASEQAQQVQAANDTAIQMASGVTQVAATAEQVATASHETRKAAEHGGIAVRETTAAMAEIQRVVGQAADTVEELGKLGEKIGAVVETIDDIAEQTNLLALNAAIEAARAGEHGRGFAVVADEVRKLAERSSRETKQIADLIQQVQAGTKHAVTAMQAGAAKVEQGSQKAGLAGQALEAILTAVEHTVRQAREIATASQELAAGARRVTDAMTSISAIVEENTAATEQMSAQSGQVAQAIQSIAAVAEEQSASTEEVSASAEEMSVQIDEMTAQAQELSSTAEQLRRLVARFRLQEVVAEGSTNVVALRRAA
jgi:methyl-accepting chemotaxis protein